MSSAPNVEDELARRRRRTHGPVDTSGGGPHDPGMDERVKKLEEFAEGVRTELHAIDVRLTKIDGRLDQMATKADLSDAMNAQVKWMVGVATGLGVAFLTIITFVLNNAVPKSPAPAPIQPAQTVVYAYPAPAPGAPQAPAVQK